MSGEEKKRGSGTALFAFSDQGCMLAVRVAKLFGGEKRIVHSTEKFALKYGLTAHNSICADMEELFGSCRALIFICACGIAVRYIAPYVRNKTTDPAVLVIDDRGRFVIPVLSGHIGGANRLAEWIAGEIGAEAVITTATDGNGRFPADDWAARQGLTIASVKAAKAISAAILAGDVGISSEYELPKPLPAGLIRAESGDYGIYIGIKRREPYRTTLRLVPGIVALGIGCRRGILPEAVEAAVADMLSKHEIDDSAVYKVVSIDVKREEEGLLEFARRRGLRIEFCSAEELNGTAGSFTESEFVKKTVGVGNVCERAAVYGGNRLIIRKTVYNGVTCAAAVKEWRIVFDEL